MNNKIFTLVLVVIVGILVGLGVVTKQSRDPMLRELLKQQEAMLKTQKSIENKLTSAGSTGIKQFQGNTDLTNIFRKQQTLEQRITALESQFKSLQTVLQQVQC